MHMIKLSSNLVNETLFLQPAFRYVLPDREHLTNLMDQMMNQFYVVGRTWIIKQVNTEQVLIAYQYFDGHLFCLGKSNGSKYSNQSTT